MSKQYKNVELKIIPSSNSQVDRLNKFFESATRAWYYIVNNSVTDDKRIKAFRNDVLGSSFLQGMVREFKALLKSQRELKKLGKSGKIKPRYKFSVTHYTGVTVKLEKENRIKIQKLGSFYVRGLRQLDKYSDYKIVTVKVMKRATGFYVHLTVEVDIPESKPIKYIGLDFGIKTQIVASNGYFLDYNNHPGLLKIESRIVRLQQALSRKIKGSRNFRRLKYLIRYSFEKLEFVKREIINKNISVFRNFNLVFQDELIKQWHKSGFKGIRKRVQHTFMGRILARLKQLSNVQIIDSKVATTKTCLNCRQKNDIKLSDRIYRCPSCGYTMKRDLHSALNMLRFAGFTYQECILDPRINFSFNKKELANLQVAGIAVTY